MALLGEAGEGDVQLRAATGPPISISKKAACMSGTLRAMLTGVSKVEGDDETSIRLTEIEEQHLARAVEYMQFKLAKQGGATPLFAVDGEQAVDGGDNKRERRREGGQGDEGGGGEREGEKNRADEGDGPCNEGEGNPRRQ